MPVDLMSACERWVNYDPMPRIVIGLPLVVRWLNLPAADLLDQNRDMYEQDGMLRFEQHASETLMTHAVEAASAALSHVCVPTADATHLLIRLRRIEDAGTPPLVGLAFNRCLSEARLQLADLKQAFGLTPAEQEIVLLLHEGLTADTIRSALKLSVGTVRSHIRSVYEKLNVGSREALFRKLTPYRI